MRKLHFTNKAIEDLKDIWDYTDNVWGEEQADRYYYDILRECNKIAEGVYVLGKKYDDISEGLRGFRVNKHIVFYKEKQGVGIVVIRILHQRMDVSIHLQS